MPGDFGALRAGERVADALHAFVVVRRRGAAGLDADRAALRLDRHHQLGDVDADVVVVRADIGDALGLVLRQKVGVPRQHRDLVRGGALQRIGHRRRVGGRDGDAVDPLGDEIGDDLRFLVAAAVLAGADVEALDRAVEFLFRLLAAGEGLVKERIVGVLGHQRERIGIRRLRGRAPLSPARTRRSNPSTAS